MVTLGLALAPLVLVPLAQSSLSYGEPPFLQAHYPPGASSVATGDLDGDGDQDVATVGGGLRVLWNSGAGWVEQLDRIDLPVSAVESADLDGDGFDDLVVAGTGAAYTLLSDGQGGFGTPLPWSIAGQATTIRAADLDADGRVDLIVATDAVSGGLPAQIEVLLGDGLGGFLSTAVISPWKAISLEVGDVDRDGHLDLLAVPESLSWPPSTDPPGPYLFRGDGQGGLLPAAAPLHEVSRVLDAILLDLDGDSWLEVVTASLDSTGVLVLRGSPDRELRPEHVGLWDYAADLCGGDLDGDGDVDLIARTFYGNGVEVLLNDGLGGLTDVGRIGIGDPWMSSRADELVDLDGDGVLDLVAASMKHVSLLLGDGAGWFRLPEALPGVGAPLSAASVAIADVDGDGALDVVAGAGSAPTLLGDGLGGFQGPFLSPGADGRTLALGDLDGDGALDLVLGGFAFYVYPPPPPQGGVIALGDGTGRFPHVTALPLGGRAVSPAIGDLDHDGDLDVVFADNPGVCVLLGDGGGSFATTWLPGSPAQALGLALGDVDLDGHVDIAAACGNVVVLRGDGTGAFPWIDQHDLDLAACIAIADLDRDALPDLAVGHRQSGISILWGLGGGQLSRPEPVEGSNSMTHPRDLEVADVDGDGTSELIVACEGSTEGSIHAGTLAVLRSTAPRELTWWWSFGPVDGIWSVAAGDLDRDGRIDLVSGSTFVYDLDSRQYTYPVTLLLNQLPPEPACTAEVTYCVARINSAGCLPRICSDGTPTLSGPDDFVVRAERVMSQQYGMLLWSGAAATLPFQGGTLCLAAPITRTQAQASGGLPGANDCSGTFACAFTQAYMAAHGLTAGSPVFAQFWSRDLYQLPPGATGLTDALSFTVGP